MKTEEKIYINPVEDFIVNDEFLTIDFDTYRLKYINYVRMMDDENYYSFEFGYNDGCRALNVLVKIENMPTSLWDFLEFSASENNGFADWKGLDELEKNGIDKDNDEAVMSEAMALYIAGHNDNDVDELKDHFVSEYHKWMNRNEEENNRIFNRYMDTYEDFINALTGNE